MRKAILISIQPQHAVQKLYEGSIYGNLKKSEAVKCEEIATNELNKIDKLKALIENMIVEADEFGLEPTIPCHEEGKDITKRWAKAFEDILVINKENV